MVCCLGPHRAWFPSGLERQTGKKRTPKQEALWLQERQRHGRKNSCHMEEGSQSLLLPQKLSPTLQAAVTIMDLLLPSGVARPRWGSPEETPESRVCPCVFTLSAVDSSEMLVKMFITLSAPHLC
jgi:hypothetical protein